MFTPSMHLAIALLCLPGITSGFNAEQVNIRMFPQTFHGMVLRESYYELNSIPKTRRGKVWRTKSKRYFRSLKGSCRNSDSEPCSLPFVYCDSSPSLSAFKRRERISNTILSRTPVQKRNLVKVESLPMYNSVKKTCFVASMTPKVARRIASTSCSDEESMCVIHPLMPMLKVSQGTVTSITQNSENDDIPVISVIAELSPYFKGKEEDIALADIARDIVASGSSKEACQWQVDDSFPSTATSVACEHSLQSMEIDVDWAGASTAVFNIQKTEESSEIQREKVLRFISGLAVRGEVKSIEGGSDSYYVYY